ncbi:Protein kinase domain-containing protein [Mycena kentingensis (nom. inval.)]|nr:Protein kinase domain-containing protein [Mycena kentingensis (nom. inval.)]
MFVDPSRVLANALAVSSAEAASLGGRKAKTPMLAGAIIGSIMGAAYVVGFTIYFYKRCRRKKLKRLVENGQAPPEVLERKKDGEEEEREQERVVIPPDPAVLLGEYKAGDVVVVDEKKHRRHPSYHRAKSSPGNGVHRDGEAGGSTSALVRTDTEDMAGRPSEASTPVTPHPNVPT